LNCHGNLPLQIAGSPATQPKEIPSYQGGKTPQEDLWKTPTGVSGIPQIQQIKNVTNASIIKPSNHFYLSIVLSKTLFFVILNPDLSG